MSKLLSYLPKHVRDVIELLVLVLAQFSKLFLYLLYNCSEVFMALINAFEKMVEVALNFFGGFLVRKDEVVLGVVDDALTTDSLLLLAAVVLDGLFGVDVTELYFAHVSKPLEVLHCF